MATDPVILDTETTGLDYDSEIVEIAMIDIRGNVLLNSLCRPTKPIPPDAEAIHGISNQDVREAPDFDDLWENHILDVWQSRHLLIYNKGFDLRMICQSAEPWDIKVGRIRRAYCAMLMYAEWYGDWNDYHESYKWQKLTAAVDQCGIQLPENLQAHRALGDCLMTLELIKYMATT